MADPFTPDPGRHDGPHDDRRDLVVRPGSAVKRDVYKAATAGLTGITAFGALAVTGGVAGVAAHQKALEDAATPAQPAVTPQVVVKRRKHRTVIRTRIVHEASAAAVARPATGGSVSSGFSGSTHASGGSSHSSGSGGGSATHSAPRPAAPAPAPSSGS